MGTSTTVLFVHGTGVRQPQYDRTLEVIAARVASRNRAVEVSGCYWGEQAGARLRLGGYSVPGYVEEPLARPRSEQEVLDLWAMLYADPWYELRLLRDMRRQPGPPEGGPSGAAALRESVRHYQPSERMTELLARYGATARFESAVRALSQAPEFRRAAATAPRTPLEHRGAIARAVIAHVAAAAQAEGEPPLGGAVRDALVDQMTADLHGTALGVGAYLAGQRNKFLSHLLTRKLVGERGSLTRSATPMAGDVLRYLARGSEISACVRRAIEGVSTDSVLLIGHSLGGIICVDLLAREHLATVRALITVGSQAPFLYEIGALPSLEPPRPLPAHFPRWSNVYDLRDILSYTAAGVFPDRVSDVEVDSGEPFPAAHSAYWSNDAFWDHVESELP